MHFVQDVQVKEQGHVQRDIGFGGQFHTIYTEYFQEAFCLVPTSSHLLQ